MSVTPGGKDRPGCPVDQDDVAQDAVHVARADAWRVLCRVSGRVPERAVGRERPVGDHQARGPRELLCALLERSVRASGT